MMTAALDDVLPKNSRQNRWTLAMAWGGAILVIVGVASAGSAQERRLRKVALLGDEAPNTGGAKFSNAHGDAFDEPFINTSCNVTFNACYAGGSAADGCGTFLWRNGVLEDIVHSGTPLPGGVGSPILTNKSNIDGPIFNNGSTVGLVIQAFNANTPAVVQKKLNGSPTILAKAGDPVPGTTKGVFTNFDDISQDNNDDLAFIGKYTEDMGATFKAGVFLKPNGQPLEKIILDGDPLPSGCGTFNPAADFPDGPWMNDVLSVAFQIDTACGTETVFIKRRGMPIELLVKLGDPGPASIGGTIDGIAPGRPGLNNRNTLGFRADIIGGSVESALLTKTLGGTTEVCVKKDAPAPGTMGTLEGFGGEEATNQTGSMFVQADLAGDPNVRSGIFLCRGGVVEAIALQGDPAPGTNSVFTNGGLEEGSLGDGDEVVFMHEHAPIGVFASCKIPPKPTPALNRWMTLGVGALLLGIGVLRLKRRMLA